MLQEHLGRFHAEPYASQLTPKIAPTCLLFLLINRAQAGRQLWGEPDSSAAEQPSM